MKLKLMKAMNRNVVRLFSAASALGLASVAHAGFVNGGFETGDFTGWTLEHGLFTGGGAGSIVYSPGSAGHAYVIGPVADPYSPFDTPFNGTQMARLNEFTSPLRDATRISQTATMLAGETDIFINWAAVMEDPAHPINDEPFFDITIKKNGVLFAQENHRADQGVAGGWTLGGTGPNGSQIYYDSGQFHVAGLVAGDSVQVILTVTDCAQSGHAGWAYLDGIGTTSQPPPPGVPDGGSTAMLLLPVLSGLVALRRKS